MLVICSKCVVFVIGEFYVTPCSISVSTTFYCVGYRILLTILRGVGIMLLSDGETAMKTEEKTTYTPGPWESQRDFDGDNAIYSEDVLIAVTSGEPDISVEQDCANASLIAKAPDMAELLREFLKYPFQSNPGSPISRTISMTMILLAEIERAQ